MSEWGQFDPVPDLTVRIAAGSSGIRAIDLNPREEAAGRRNDSNPFIREALGQLRAYFAGKLQRFNLPLELQGTEFQIQVWQALQRIPYGETRSYRDIAAAIGRPRAVRAVGAANGRNPIPILVPCHRVIGARGDLVGYGGGLPIKKLLLALEAQHVDRLGKAAPG